ncbi:MAG: GspE/PulE family protein, partial [Solirubrobacteraceae bacterium]
MSEARQPAEPDLHAIFGIDGDPVISVERPGEDPEMDAPGGADAGQFEVFPDADGAGEGGAPAIELDVEAGFGEEPGGEEGWATDAPGPAAGAGAAPVEGEPGWAGITSPSQRGSSARFLTDVIVELQLASKRQVDDAIETSRNSGTPPERILLDQGIITADGLARALAERYGLDHLDLGVFSVDMSAANLISTTVAKRYQAVPVAFSDKRTLLVAMADPSNVLAVDDIAIMTGHEVRVAVAPPDDIASLISRLDRLEDVVGSPEELGEVEEDGGEVVALHESSEDAPVIKLVNQIVGQAVERGASDIHFAPDGKEVRVRFRIDGVLQDITTVPRRMAAGAVSRVKIMAELNIAEKRLPQDGRIGLVVDGRHVDLRVVTLPSVHGEGIVMRVLDKSNVVVDLDKLGMADNEREQFERSCRETHGAVLVTGPTGSGKSTTLYAALQLLNTP